MVMSRLMWAAFKALIIALVLTPIVRDVFRAYNVVDRPGGRTVHAYPTPRVGGVSIAVAYAAAVLAFFGPKGQLPDYYSEALKLLPGALVIFVTGLLDDFLNLRPAFKLLGQIAAGAAVFALGLRIDTVVGFSLPLWLSLLCTIFWLLLSINALNLIDGLDGLCAGMGFLAAMTLFAAGVIQGVPALTFTMLPLAGALLGFLFFNFNPATVFLGDSGALMIGFLLGCGGIIWKNKPGGGGRIAVPLLALSIPLLDLSVSIVRRSLKGQKIFSADRGHIHHRLLDRGLVTRRAALALYLMALPGIAAALVLSFRVTQTFQAIVVLLVALVAGLGIVLLRYPEFEVAWGLLFRGEFRRVLAGKVRLAQLRTALLRSETDEDWWKVLAHFCAQEGMVSVEWLYGAAATRGDSNGRSARKHVISSRPVVWSFEIPLEPNECVRIEGDLKHEREAFDLVAFSDVVTKTFPAHRRQHKLPAFS
jgi:UDP-GlcNAc:undecaprenyl-phosphate/decaprenyl-phosphate GlcNAc-1-phosphate transferase